MAETGLICSVQIANDHSNGDTGPGVIVGTILTAVLVKYTFPYGWNWVEVLLFGAMFSATDPVAVVAVLKEVIHAASLLEQIFCLDLVLGSLAPGAFCAKWHD